MSCLGTIHHKLKKNSMKNNYLVPRIIKRAVLSVSVVFVSVNTSAQTAFAIIAASPVHTSLEAALLQQGLNVPLSNSAATLTVFAPDDNAFAALATSLGTNVAGLLALPNLTDILTYHVLGTTVLSSAITNGQIVQPLSTTNTLKLTVTTAPAVFVNQAQVTTANITASNGVVHVVNAVLRPVETVADVAIDGAANFSTLVAAVVEARLLPALTDPNAQLTVFAPTNAAFTALTTTLGVTTAQLLALPNLADILKYHVLGTEVVSSAITNGQIVQPLSTTNTLKLTVTTAPAVFVNQAQVTTPNVQADNGVVHVLNAVLLPVETVADVAIDGSANFSTLVAAVVQARLLPALTNPASQLTVFAPTNAAFAALATSLSTTTAGLLALPNLADILTYHVLGTEVVSSAITNGQIVQPLSTTNTLKLTVTTAPAVFVNQAQVTTPNVQADNGVVHVLNAVVLPVETVVDIAIDNGFSTLVAALVKAELVPTLINPAATVTVFAPTNTAFDNLATALGTNLAGILALPNLADVLKYHVLGSELLANQLVNGPIATLSTQNVIINTVGGVKVNSSNVTTPNLQSTNGIVHVIDRVLLSSYLGVDELNKVDVQVAPNPSTDVIRFSNITTEEYMIYNVVGAVVQSGKVTNNELNISNLENGNYFLRLTNNEGTYQTKFVKI
jgi:uncharacterized surface protein with fasciclin (FAS1) repeats